MKNESDYTMSETHSRTCMKEIKKPAGYLTSLPAELRLLIYGHLFRGTKHVVVASGGYADKARQYDEKNKSTRIWSILLTCRGLHDEAWPSYWAHARVKAYCTWRQLPEALSPSTPMSRIRHLSLRIHTLSARWDQILPDLEQTVPNLQTLVIRDEDLYLEPDHWLELLGGSSSSSFSSSCGFAETQKTRQERAQKVYHEIIAPSLFGHYHDNRDDDDDTHHTGSHVETRRDRSTLSKLRSRDVLRDAAAWPRHRVVVVPLITDKVTVGTTPTAAARMEVSNGSLETETLYGLRSMRMWWFYNYGNDKMSLVTNVDKGKGLIEVC